MLSYLMLSSTKPTFILHPKYLQGDGHEYLLYLNYTFLRYKRFHKHQKVYDNVIIVFSHIEFYSNTMYNILHNV